MWVAIIKIDCSKAIFGGACKKYKVSVVGYPILVRKHKNFFTVHFTFILSGEDKSKKSFISFLKKHKRVSNVEIRNDFVIGQLKEKEFVEPMYKYSIIHKEPVRISNDGTEFWTIASFSRKDLVDFIDRTEKYFNAEIMQIREDKVSNLSVLTLYPELTDIQKRAMELAIKNGYYDSPRKIDVKNLAKIMKLSYATYHVHLRKAEKKIIPFLFERNMV